MSEWATREQGSGWPLNQMHTLCSVKEVSSLPHLKSGQPLPCPLTCQRTKTCCYRPAAAAKYSNGLPCEQPRLRISRKKKSDKMCVCNVPNLDVRADWHGQDGRCSARLGHGASSPLKTSLQKIRLSSFGCILASTSRQTQNTMSECERLNS